MDGLCKRVDATCRTRGTLSIADVPYTPCIRKSLKHDYQSTTIASRKTETLFGQLTCWLVTWYTNLDNAGPDVKCASLLYEAAFRSPLPPAVAWFPCIWITFDTRVVLKTITSHNSQETLNQLLKWLVPKHCRRLRRRSHVDLYTWLRRLRYDEVSPIPTC